MIERIAHWFPWLLLAPAVIPLIYIEGLLYPYVTPKTLLFRGLFILAAAAFAYLALSGRQFYFNRMRNWSTWIPGALLVVAYLTSLLGLDFYHSFWSIFDRGDGLLTLTSAVGFFYLILLHADKDFIRKLFSAAAWVGSLVALYTFFQWLQATTGMDFPLVDVNRGRIGGTLGNAAFLAAYLGMTLFATLAVMKEYRGMRQKILYAGAALQLLGIFFSATRGTLLALIAVGIVAALYLAWKGSGNTQKFARYSVIAGVIVAGLFFTFRGPLSQAPFEPIRRLASISVQDTTVSSRLFVWENVLAEGMKRPFTGYGAEHIDVLFNKVYDPGAIIEEWFDRSHNAYLDYFVQYGLLGVALYIGVILALMLSGWRLMRSGDRYGAYIVLIALVYAMQNFFVFDTAMTLWFLLAVMGATLARESVASVSSFRTAPNFVSVGIGVVILALLYPVALQPMRANLALAEGYNYHVIAVQQANEAMRKGLSLNTYADLEYGYQAYVMYTDRQQTMLKGEERIAAYEYALDILTKNYEHYPYDARTATYLAHVLDSAPPEKTVDEAFLQSVIARAQELSPQRAQPFYILANISLKKGDRASNVAEKNRYYREAITGLETYAAMVPRLAEARYILANVTLATGDRVGAKKWADEGLALYNDHGGGATPSKAIKYYIAVEDWANALRFAKDELGDIETTTEYEELYDLAKLYYLNNDKESARAIYERIKKEKPGLVETDPAFVAVMSS